MILHVLHKIMSHINRRADAVENCIIKNDTKGVLTNFGMMLLWIACVSAPFGIVLAVLAKLVSSAVTCLIVIIAIAVLAWLNRSDTIPTQQYNPQASFEDIIYRWEVLAKLVVAPATGLPVDFLRNTGDYIVDGFFYFSLPDSAVNCEDDARLIRYKIEHRYSNLIGVNLKVIRLNHLVKVSGVSIYIRLP